MNGNLLIQNQIALLTGQPVEPGKVPEADSTTGFASMLGGALLDHDTPLDICQDNSQTIQPVESELDLAMQLLAVQVQQVTVGLEPDAAGYSMQQDRRDDAMPEPKAVPAGETDEQTAEAMIQPGKFDLSNISRSVMQPPRGTDSTTSTKQVPGQLAKQSPSPDSQSDSHLKNQSNNQSEIQTVNLNASNKAEGLETAELARVSKPGLERVAEKAADMPEKSQSDFAAVLNKPALPDNSSNAAGVHSASDGQTIIQADQDLGESVVRQVVDKAELYMSGSRQVIRIRLKPDYLGELDIQVSRSDGQIKASIKADKAETGDLINGQLVQLQGALEARGIKVDTIQVQIEPQDSAQMTNDFGQSLQQQGRQQSLEEGSDLARSVMETELESDEIELQQMTPGRINTVV